MPERLEVTGYTDYQSQYDLIAEPEPTVGETFSSAFRMENDVVAAFNFLNRRKIQPDPQFNIQSAFTEYGIERDHWENFIGVRSKDEFIARKTQIDSEEADRRTLAASGWAGTTAMVTAGMLSPTMFIPFAGTGTKAIRLTKAALSGMTSAAAQEAMLYADQETRTGGEMAFSVASSAIISGLLGAALPYTGKAEIDAAARDMAMVPGNAYGSTAGAAQVIEGGAGKFDYAPGMDILARLGPITRGIQQPHAPKVFGTKIESPTWRRITSIFGDAGLRFEQNKAGRAAAPGGTIEDLVVTYARHSADTINTLKKSYYDYFFDSAAPAVGKAVRTTIGTAGKLSKQEFSEQVTAALRTGVASSIPQVNDVAMFVKSIHKKLYDEAKEVGLYKELDADKEVAALMGDANYVFRDWNPDAVQRQYGKFIDVLSANYEAKLQDQFTKRWQKLNEKNQRTLQTVEDMKLNEEEAFKALEKFRAEIGALEKAAPGVKELDEDIAALDAATRLISKTDNAAFMFGRKNLKDLRAERKALIKAAGEALPEYRVKRRELARRLSNITKSRGLVEARHRAVVDSIEKNESLSLKVMNRAARKAQRLLAFLKSGSQKKIDKAAEEARQAFELAGKIYDDAEGRIVKLIEKEEPDMEKLLVLEERQNARRAKMTALSDRIAELKNFNRADWEKEVQSVLDDLLEPYNDLILRRGMRQERLVNKANELRKSADPKVFEGRVKELTDKVLKRAAEFGDTVRQRGGDQVDLTNGKADFKAISRETAEDVAAKIMGTNGRMAWADLIREKRGMEYARMLDIPSDTVKDFLENDIERLVVSYVKTLGADIPLTKKFGAPNIADAFLALEDERKIVLEKLQSATNKNGDKLEGSALEKAQMEIGEFYRNAHNDLETLLQRVRHERGVPRDPRSWGARGARMALNLNTARFMGGVLLSSVPDIARPVMKYGLARVMKDGLLPMITNFKTIRMSQREAQLAGTANDIALHARAKQLYDVFDDAARGNKFERGIEYMSSKIGLIGLFDHWTVAMKQFTAGLANAKLLDSIEVVMTPGASAKRLADATTYLASKNLTPAHMETIWKQVTGGPGGGKVNGVWLPNTESWAQGTTIEKESLQAYRAALVSDIDDTIVTPGLERPSWMDANLPAKMLAQFKSFGMSSTFKTLMAGLQQRDMAFVNGTLISLAFGVLSYYLWAKATGGKAEQEMMNAGLDKWVDEAITRSGVLGVFDEIQRGAQHIPYVQAVASFSGRPSTRREGGDAVEAVLGPSFDLLEKVGGVVTSIDDPTASTVHQARTMLPWQNVFWLRQAFDKMEQVTVDTLGIPERKN